MVYHSLTHSTVALALFYLQFAFALFILSLSLLYLTPTLSLTKRQTRN